MLDKFTSKFYKGHRIDNIENRYNVHNMQTCTVTIDADSLTVTVGTLVTLSATVSPPGVYDVIFRWGVNPLGSPITTDINGVASLPLDTTGQIPGLYDMTAEVVNPTPPPAESCVSSPITLALTTGIVCTGIAITNPPSPVNAYIGDIIPVSISATVTEPCVAEIRMTEADIRVGSCVLDTSGNCTINTETTGAPPGTYHVAAYIGHGTGPFPTPEPQCASPLVEVTLQEKPGKIAVIAIPPGGRIYYDGNDTGMNSSAIIADVAPSVPHSVVIKLSGYTDYDSGPITVMPEGIEPVFAIMVPTVPPTGVGNLDVTSTPVDGVEFGLYTGEMGITPTSILDIPAGINAYESGLFGYNGAMGSLIIKDGETTNLNIPLQLATPDMGMVAIESIPMEADIYIDGSPINAKTSFMTSMSPGYHTYELRLSGYQSKSGSFTVVTGYDMPAIVSEILQPVSGTGAAMMLGIVGVAALGMMMISKPK